MKTRLLLCTGLLATSCAHASALYFYDTRTGIQVIAKHAFEPFGIVVCNLRPGLLKTGVPCHQCGVVIRAEVMPVFHNEVGLAGVSNLPHGR